MKFKVNNILENLGAGLKIHLGIQIHEYKYLEIFFIRANS